MKCDTNVLATLRAGWHKLRRSRFDNRTFWNDRYTKDPDRGSGPGSRGDLAVLKGGIVQPHLFGQHACPFTAGPRHGIMTARKD